MKMVGLQDKLRHLQWMVTYKKSYMIYHVSFSMTLNDPLSRF